MFDYKGEKNLSTPLGQFFPISYLKIFPLVTCEIALLIYPKISDSKNPGEFCSIAFFTIKIK
jgi:hypothetical protein